MSQNTLRHSSVVGVPTTASHCSMPVQGAPEEALQHSLRRQHAAVMCQLCPCSMSERSKPVQGPGRVHTRSWPWWWLSWPSQASQQGSWALGAPLSLTPSSCSWGCSLRSVHRVVSPNALICKSVSLQRWVP